MSSKTLTIDERFDKIDAQFTDVRTDMATQFAAMNKQLDRIVTIVVQGFDRIEKALEQKTSVADVQRLYGLVDTLVKRQEISDDERLVMAHQLTRLHEWVEQAAVRIDLKFEH